MKTYKVEVEYEAELYFGAGGSTPHARAGIFDIVASDFNSVPDAVRKYFRSHIPHATILRIGHAEPCGSVELVAYVEDIKISLNSELIGAQTLVHWTGTSERDGLQISGTTTAVGAVSDDLMASITDKIHRAMALERHKRFAKCEEEKEILKQRAIRNKAREDQRLKNLRNRRVKLESAFTQNVMRGVNKNVKAAHKEIEQMTKQAYSRLGLVRDAA